MAVMKGLAQDERGDAHGLVDMEDVCNICSGWNTESPEDVTGAADVPGAGGDARRPPRRPARRRPEQAEAPSSPSPRSASLPGREGQHDDRDYALSPEAAEVAVSHARRFPVKVSKKTVREEETVVCAVRRASDGCYLIQKRPDKGKPATEEEVKMWRHQLTLASR